jgi:hypothetical protein
MSDWKDWGGGVIVVIMSSVSCSDHYEKVEKERL